MAPIPAKQWWYRVKVALTLVCCWAAFNGSLVCAQALYFPPVQGSQWDTVSPTSLQWCTQHVPALESYLLQSNTRAFLVLHQGKIAMEYYANGGHRDSLWYWASAGKSLTAFLVGLAVADAQIDVQQPVSTYLGAGWTSSTTAQEQQIKVVHQLSMTTGLNDQLADPDCTLDTCLHYLADAGTRWAYHNAPYTLLEQVLANATGRPINQYVFQKLRNSTGIQGLYLPLGFNRVFFSTARHMARFGLLLLNQGHWDTLAILSDTAFMGQMMRPSQALNQSYGYLWWLNGQASYRLPQTQLQFNGPLMPHAPSDTRAALGKDGQIINIVPSEQLVVVRMGEAPGTGLVPINYNDSIWRYLRPVICTPLAAQPARQAAPRLFPNPFHERVEILPAITGDLEAKVYNMQGQQVADFSNQTDWSVAHWPPGMYIFSIRTHGQQYVLRAIKAVH